MHHIYLTFDVLTCFHTGLLTGLLSVGGRDYVKEDSRGTLIFQALKRSPLAFLDLIWIPPHTYTLSILPFILLVDFNLLHFQPFQHNPFFYLPKH